MAVAVSHGNEVVGGREEEEIQEGELICKKGGEE